MTTKLCKGCGVEFTPNAGRTLYCKKACYLKDRRSSWRTSYQLSPKAQPTSGIIVETEKNQGASGHGD